MLTNQQLDTIKSWIVANVPNATEHTAQEALNSAASPAYWCYRSEVIVSEVMTNGFDWTRVDNLSVGKSRIWEWMTRAKTVNNAFVFDPSKANIRAGINETWKGTAADLAVRAAVYVHCVRQATNVEKLLKSAGNGTATDANGDGPATLGFVGPISLNDTIAAMNRP